MLRKLFLAALTGAAMALTTTSIATASDYPSKPIEIVVGVTPGGGVDAFARAVGDQLKGLLDTGIVVENRPGGGGAAAAAHVKKAPADGYTIGMIFSAVFSTIPMVMDVGYDIDDFEYLGAANEMGLILVSRSDAGYTDWKGMIASAKDRGYLRYASISILDRMVMEAIARQEGFDLDVLPTTGGNEARAALVAGDADLTLIGAASLNFVDANKETMIVATLNPERPLSVPDHPTLRELGYDLDVRQQFVFFATKGLPAEVLEKLESAIQTVLHKPEMEELLTRMSSTFKPRNSAETLEQIRLGRETVMKMLGKG